MMESLVSHGAVALLAAGIVWYADRSVKRQFRLMLDAISEGKLENKDWRFVRDASGRPVGFRLMHGASAASDRPGI